VREHRGGKKSGSPWLGKSGHTLQSNTPAKIVARALYEKKGKELDDLWDASGISRKRKPIRKRHYELGEKVRKGENQEDPNREEKERLKEGKR